MPPYTSMASPLFRRSAILRMRSEIPIELAMSNSLRCVRYTTRSRSGEERSLCTCGWAVKILQLAVHRTGGTAVQRATRLQLHTAYLCVAFTGRRLHTRHHDQLKRTTAG